MQSMILLHSLRSTRIALRTLLARCVIGILCVVLANIVPVAAANAQGTNGLEDVLRGLALAQNVTFFPDTVTVHTKADSATISIVNNTHAAVQVSLSTSIEQEKAPFLKEWIKDLPSSFTIEAGKSRTVTFHVAIPDDLKPGVYSSGILPFVKPAAQADANSFGLSRIELIYKAP